MPSLDELITEYTALDKYTGPVERMIGLTERFGHSIDRVLRLLFNPIAFAGAGGFLGLGAEAIKIHSEFEALKAGLESITGSAERAAEKFQFMKQLAIPAPFTFQDLAHAGIAVENFGLRIEKVLPLIVKLTAIPHDMIHLMEAVRVFGEIAGGTMPNARQMASLGLNRHMLEQAGFDSESGDVKKNLEALEAVINKKYGDILEKMRATTRAKLTSAQDAWRTFMDKIGEALSKILNPALEHLTQLLNRLSTSKKFEEFLGGVEKALKRTIGVMKVLAGIMAGLITAALITGLYRLVAAVIALADGFSIAAVWAAVLEAVTENLPGVVMGVIALLAGLYAALTTMKSLNDLQKRLEDELRKQFPGQSGGLPEDTHPDEGWGPDIADSSQQTADNTREMASTMSSLASDLRRYVVGGGPLAQIGITPIELGRQRAGHLGAGGTVRVDAGNQKLSSWLEELIIKIMMENERQRRPVGLGF